ncbi:MULTISPECIES: NAD+ synthase [unclassified Undibacterium]|uniref:NAD+ synthase n=1 Tax=unclassified Undibacterium TaxID=2630295 RepID=UPI002AC8C259|nr:MULTISPECIES: NAD+ synthase [unclassified Undibacterium]MEB0140366.1 NAD+ synthase [Undibacterium sp. CCC2.1]MEB0173389.1 NAD+ synthase [Undibacterium sp. CCC1.1]MEB0176786.1 NAD+ synthase [Undibacterium sp. CCC3.4]MEB0216557.1 NAD+ synthase [Undibacterium sp. 5I2]WPX43393.1 NAD+ synthase [Undibacterium sp. CCC3.4]
MKTIKVAIAQINSRVGDIDGNAALILAAATSAAERGADIVITPELSLVGYPPEDLLLRPAFYAQAEYALNRLATQLAAQPDVHVLVGHPLARDGRYYNAVSVLLNGGISLCYCKQKLPNDSVFDELRYFSAGNAAAVFDVKGLRFGINICEDTWSDAAPLAARAAGAEVLLVANASPFHMEKQGQRAATMRRHVTAAGMALVYANLVGAQDELLFDGNSFVLDAAGVMVAQLRHCEEDLQIIEFHGAQAQPLPLPAPAALEQQVYAALVLGVRDYVRKNGFPGVLLGLSGGVDSALTLAIAVDALGAENVRAVMMPSPYTADISLLDSREMVKRIGVRYDEIAIAACFDAFRSSLATEFAGLKEDTTEENIQARIRGTMLMALSNKYGSIVLTTGNKSEMAVGYCTLYGDMAGGFAVIKDIAKTLVYRLCAWRNTVSDVIPERILTRPPSAELRPDQTDQDTLPPYEVLDAIMRLYMEENRSRAEIVAAGYAHDDVERITRLIKINEYKRRQAPIGIRITHRAFGRDWRYPVTSAFRD